MRLISEQVPRKDAIQLYTELIEEESLKSLLGDQFEQTREEIDNRLTS
jgi:hypothetical protein